MLMKSLGKSLVAGSIMISMLAGVSMRIGAEEVELELQEAEKEVVVTAARLATPAGQVGGSISVITAADIEQRQLRTVYEALRNMEGLHVARSGGRGAVTSVFLRGTDRKHVKVMINGVMITDPSDPGRAFDFAHLSTDNIERIEVLRGSQSTLYGSDAVGGVINIITREGEGPPSVTVSTEYGTYDTSIQRFGLSGAEGPFSYALSGSYTDSRGIDHTGSPDGRDGYRNTSAGVSLGVRAAENLRLDLIYRYEDAMSEYDGWDAMFQPADWRALLDRHFVRSQATMDLAGGLWEQIIGIGRTDTKRRDRRHADGLVDKFRGKTLKLDWQHNLYLHDRNTLTAGVEWEEEKADVEAASWNLDMSARTSTTGGFIQNRFEPVDDLFITAGIRTDRHEDFGSRTTYSLSGSYLLRDTDTRLRGSFGTGFRAPSLFELYNADSGNRDLDPEKSRGWDAGVEQGFFDGRLRAEATYFENRIDDMIGWVPLDPDAPWMGGEQENTGRIKTSGVETRLSGSITGSVTVWGGYTLTKTRDDDGDELLRRPRDRYTAGAAYGWREGSSVSLTAHHVGRRYDWPGDVRLGSYTLVNLAASHEIFDNVTIFGRIENLTREDYEEADGYKTPGRAFFAGLQARF